jgi:hypothetical protein
MQVIHIDDVLGGDPSRSDPNNDRGVRHHGEEESQEGDEEEGDQEEGRQEEEVIDLGQLDLLGSPDHSRGAHPMNKAKAAVPFLGTAAKLLSGLADLRSIPISFADAKGTAPWPGKPPRPANRAKSPQKR